MRRPFAAGCRHHRLRPLPGGELLILVLRRVLIQPFAVTASEEPVNYTRIPLTQEG